MVAVSLDYAVEMTHHLGESVSTAMLMSSATLCSIVYIVVGRHLIDRKSVNGGKLCLILFLAATASTLLVCPFLKENLKRRDEEESKRFEAAVESYEGLSRRI